MRYSCDFSSLDHTLHHAQKSRGSEILRSVSLEEDEDAHAASSIVSPPVAAVVESPPVVVVKDTHTHTHTQITRRTHKHSTHIDVRRLHVSINPTHRAEITGGVGVGV
jgi:hypothetical protein